jgi:hypothetical protein
VNRPVLSIDPGSKRTGWAVLTQREQLLQAGLLTGDKTTDPAKFRIAAMCWGLCELLDEWQPGTVLIEWSSGHVGRRRHKGGGAGLAVYGIAIGALWQVAVAWSTSGESRERQVRVRCIEENLWTNRVPKEDRVATIAQRFREYHSEDDPGGDVADAIGLGLWWTKQQSLVSV